MNRTFLITTAALAAAFMQPVYAKDNDRSGGGRDGGGARFHGSAPMNGAPRAEARAEAPRAQARVQSAPRVSADSRTIARTDSRMERAPSQFRERTVTPNRTVTTRRESPTIAFTGTRNVDRNTRVDSDGRYAVTRDRRDFDRSDFRRVPNEVWRNWDRRQIHTWNNHRYRWYNNDWVLFEGGVYGDSSYWYPTQYYSDSYYDVPETTSVVTYSTSDATASAVQRELARRGYNPGVIDGVIGPQTRNAIAQFQSEHRMAVTGTINGALLDELDLD